MKRREFVLKIGDKNYIFSERNREDSAYSSLQEKVKQQKFRFIQENIKESDDRLALMMAEMDKIYSSGEITLFIAGSMEEQQRICYDSFKIKNDMSFDDFKKLMPERELKGTVEMIYKIESEEHADVKKKKGMS
jgi:hypothetical protein